MWILETPLREFFYLYLPGLLSVLLAIFSPNLGEDSLFYGLLAMGIIDSGHVYTTAWRTWFHGDEVKTSAGFWLFPLGFFLFFSLWFYSHAPYLWAFVVYATLYHHTRQVYGFSKWYQKLNKRGDKVSDYFLYFFAFFPMLIYHFRPGAIGNYYTENDLFLYPWPFMRNLLLGVYVLVVVSWVLREASLWKKGIREPNRLLSVAFPSLIYAYCFLVGETLTQILFPLLFLHGVAYFGVMGQSLTRTQNRFANATLALVVVLVTAIVFGLFESWAEENVIPRSPEGRGLIDALIVGLSLTPLFCHYAFDAIIWRKDHREASAVFSPGK